MRRMKYSIPLIIMLCIGAMLQAQVVKDPVRKVYSIGGSSEIFMAYTNSDRTHAKHGVMDIPATLNDITCVEDAVQTRFMDRWKSASATGDFDGDGADEVVTVFDNTIGGIKISIPLIGEDLKLNGLKEYNVTALNDVLGYTRIRVIAGNFDDDPQDEFAICYDVPGQPLTVSLFKTDSNLEIELLASFREIAFYDRHFDIAAGDVDGDGIDEIVMVKNRAKLFERNSAVNPPIFISTYDLNILKYDPVAKKMNLQRKRDNIELENKASGGDYHHSNAIINEIRVACGDLNNDGKDEIVVGWSNYYCYDAVQYCKTYVWPICYEHAWRYYYNDMLFLNTFKPDWTKPDGEEGIVSYQNICVGNTGFSMRGVPADQHIALTLKCEQMDNLGRAEVLVNGSSGFYVYGKGDEDMGLRKLVGMSLPGGYLNIQGNESFIVADLNPDVNTMDFNKEVIILRSNKTHLEQLNTRATGTTEMVILSIDTVGTNTFAFRTPDPAHDIPFSSSDNIEITAFLAGDFDLKSAEVYFIGTPEVIPVSALQQPIVILNSPPVHFDLLDGTVYDLCNAFNTAGPPSFYAKYNTKINDQNTTSVEVDNGFGFSSEVSAYAMAGGSGFEASVNANWNKGRSFYKASSQSKTIEEAKSVYTEDYVLYSSLDYAYYKYPVFNRDQEMLGYMAVLNPMSEDFSSVWGSGNSWNHPSYIFNHEPGNILSYKPVKKTLDFCSGPSDFSFCEFSRVPVAYTGDGSFNFTYDKISSAGDSYSFSGGVGADLFTKVGIETTVSAELAPFGFGGSVSTDIRIGVASEISAYYHQSSLSTHNTELRNTFRVEGNIGRLAEQRDGDARYFITPYIYRSQSGALVLDYKVELDKDNMGWWKKNYDEQPDLAFILPWRYATEKGSADVKISKKQKTSDIQFFHPIASPGDTVIITTRVHNFSLKTFDDLLNVEYYLGDPTEGGVKLTDIYGVTGSSKLSTMIYGATDAINDCEEYFSFVWEVPDTVTCSPRIYAVIDEEDGFAEIHENNNVGWNLLNIYDCKECKYVERITGSDDVFAPVASVKAYPNPFSSTCMIRFTLPQTDAVQIDLYNLAGHKIATLTDKTYGSGEHEVSLNAGDLGDGIYFCRVTAGAFQEIIKLVLLR
ncbi:MAG: T9SS type A sorting domain-containing protein [Bacteroidales bacterium]